jgi:hypothetical protein
MCEPLVLEHFKSAYFNRKNMRVKINAFLQTAANTKPALYPGGKSIIKYKAPAKIGKRRWPTQPKPPYIPAITRYTRNREDGTNNFVLFGDQSAVEFSFTQPLIEYDKDGVLLHNYNNIKVGDRLLIWQNIDAHGNVAHLTAHIITRDGKHYSVGFGFSGKKTYTGRLPNVAGKQFMQENLGTAPGAIYTPDNVFEQKLLSQCTKARGVFVRLISAVDITQEHLTNMQEAFSRVDFSKPPKPTLRFTIVPDEGSSEEKAGLVQKIETMMTLGMYDAQYNRELEEYMEYIRTPGAKYQCIYSLGYSMDFPLEYCKYSGKRSVAHTYNCASFLHHVFADSIDCGILSYVVIDPNRCRAGPLRQTRCDRSTAMQNGQNRQKLQRQEQQLIAAQLRQIQQQKPATKKAPRVKKQEKAQQFFDAYEFLPSA